MIERKQINFIINPIINIAETKKKNPEQWPELLNAIFECTGMSHPDKPIFIMFFPHKTVKMIKATHLFKNSSSILKTELLWHN